MDFNLFYLIPQWPLFTVLSIRNMQIIWYLLQGNSRNDRWFNNTMPFYVQYVMAPISLVMLNPLGFLCLEIGERRKETQRLSSTTNSVTTISLTELPGDGSNSPSRKISTTSTVSTTSSTGSMKGGSKKSSGFKVCKNKVQLSFVEILGQ